jgi:SAM-dependent methyltransferase
MWHGEFRHPRAVQVYDAAFGWTRADDLFLAVAGEAPGGRVLDLGCGTGRLALALADAGHRVTGVDPACASLDVARAKPGADRVTWVEGTSEVLPDAAFDVALMTSHVAQFFVDDDAWRATLADLRRALVPSGGLAFDTRDPRARHWEAWNPRDSRETVTLGDGTRVDVWVEVTSVEGDVVRFAMHHAFADGEHLVGTAELRFRGEGEVRDALRDAGLEVEHVFGGWEREPVGAADGELIVLARRPPA